MIVKYLNDDVWGYIDNVRQAAVKSVDCDELIKAYNECEQYKDQNYAGQFDVASYFESEKLAADIAIANKVFLMATANQEGWGDKVHIDNMLIPSLVTDNYPAVVVLLYLEECKDYDSMAIVTNQRCFLMNDKGQTVDRLA